MKPTSKYFDSIRVTAKSAGGKKKAQPEPHTCDWSGCQKPGTHKAPKARGGDGRYYIFCIDHVRQYNANYNYFDGMSDDAMARWMKADTIGHRPTWAMGVNRAGKTFREEGSGARDPLGAFADRARRRSAEPSRPAYGIAAMKALGALGLDENADAATIKARYKELVKRLHPDANGGDRSSEDKLREIIRAYNYLRSAKLV